MILPTRGKTIEIPSELHKDLKIFCVKYGFSMGQVTEQGIKNLIKAYEASKAT